MSPDHAFVRAADVLAGQKERGTTDGVYLEVGYYSYYSHFFCRVYTVTRFRLRGGIDTRLFSNTLFKCYDF